MIDALDSHCIVRISANCSQENITDQSLIALRYEKSLPDESMNQILIFEDSPSTFDASGGTGTALIELKDGRVFFFRSSLWALQDGVPIRVLVDTLCTLPELGGGWSRGAELVGYMIGAPIAFIDMNPGKVENWNIDGWRRQAASRLAISQSQIGIQQIGTVTNEAAELLKATIQSKLLSFIARLNRSSCALANEMPDMWLTAYNNFTPANDEHRLYRRQFQETFPVFSEQVLKFPKEASSLSIKQAIDSGVPFVDYAANLFKCTKASVRHLNGLEYKNIGPRWEGRVKELLAILSSLDVNKYPKNNDEWTVFGETIDLLATMTRMPISSLSGRLLLNELSKFNWRCTVNTSVSYQERALVIENFSEKIRQAIVATAWVIGRDIPISGALSQRIATEEACSLGLSRLEKLSRKWRTEELKLGFEIIKNNSNEFPILLENPLVIGDMHVVQLRNQHQLFDEGKRMENCVGSYVSNCVSGNSYIFSVRDKSGNSRATVQYQLHRFITGLPEFTEIQTRGVKNSSAGQECHGALSALHGFIKSPGIRQKSLSLLVFQKAFERGFSGKAEQYIRALEFIKFLEREAPKKFDFARLVSVAIENAIEKAS